MWAVLDLPHAVADGLDEVLGGGEGGVGQPPASQQGPDALDRVEVGCIGGQLVDGQPVLPGDELPHAVGEMDVEVVPDEHDRAAELLMGSDEQVAVVGPGEALASVASAVVTARPVDQPGAFTGLVAGQGGNGDAAAGAAAHPDDGGVAPPGPGAGGRRRHREAGLVFEDDPGVERRRGASTCGQVSFTQPQIASSLRSTALLAGIWQEKPCRISSLRTPCRV